MAVIAPKKKPQDFGFKKGDSHLVINAVVNTMKAYDFSGKFLWEIPCLAKGQVDDYRVSQGNTPPGCYKIGDIYKDYEIYGPNPEFDRTLLAYGWYSFDLIELENQEAKYGRAGIMIHGGGSAANWPGAWAPKQPLYNTAGCCRVHNIELRDKILPLTKKGTVFASVYQEAA
jgi:hypothetical protein